MSWNRVEFLRLRKPHLPLLGLVHNSLRQRVLGLLLRARREPQQLVLAHSDRHEVSHNRLALRYGASLVEYDGAALVQKLQALRVFNENSILSALASPYHYSSRRSQ